MNLRNLFMITIAVGSALLGASVAISTHSPTTSLPIVQSLQPAAQIAMESAPQPPQTEPVLPSDSSPSVQVDPLPVATKTISTDELEVVKEQLRRAIYDRNPVLLRSLMQAGSLRQVLTTLAVPEQVNFDNLDASAWAVLEKAIAYRCRYPKVQTISEGISCLEAPSQELLQ